MNGAAGRGLLGLALLTGVATAGTYAAWNASATLAPGRVDAGTLDVTLDGALAGPGGVVGQATLALPDLVPAEGVARTVTVANAGSTPLRLTASGSASGALATDLLVSVHPGGAAANAGSAAAGTRRGTCSGTAAYGPGPLDATGRPVVAAARTLAPGATLQVCVVVALSSSAPSSQQGQAGQVQLRFDAVQEGAP